MNMASHPPRPAPPPGQYARHRPSPGETRCQAPLWSILYPPASCGTLARQGRGTWPDPQGPGRNGPASPSQRLIPHPDQAPRVTRMFEWRAYEKLSVAGIARRLTDLGAPPPGQGTAWSTSTVNRILRNPKYAGRVVLGRTTNTGPTRRRGEMKVIELPREYWTWAAPENAHEALTDMDTWEKAQTVGRERGNSMDPGTRHLGRNSGRLYPYRSKIHCNQCHRRMHGTQSATTPPGQMLVYYVCPTQMNKPQDQAKYPGHVRASIREDAITAKLGEFLDTYALGHDRASHLAALIPASQAQQDDLDQARAQALDRKRKKADAAITGIAAEIGQLAGKTDPVSTAIRERLTAQFGQRYDEKPPSKPSCRPSRTPPPCPATTCP
jgi:Recombinase